MQFPPHTCGLYLSHNEHRDYYQTIEQLCSIQNEGFYDCWISEKEKTLALETQDFWHLQWYPDTPVSFHVLSAHSLSALLAHACNIEKGEP